MRSRLAALPKSLHQVALAPQQSMDNYANTVLSFFTVTSPQLQVETNMRLPLFFHG